MSQIEEIQEHFIYPLQKDLSLADGVAQVFQTQHGQLSLYPFMFPELGENEIRLKMLYTGLCHSDCMHARQYWSPNVTYPCCVGHEIIGIATHVGKDVKRIKIGDVVGGSPQRDSCGKCDFCLKGKQNFCSELETMYDPYFGGYATHIQFPERLAYKIPDGMPLEKISPLLCAGLTVFAPLKAHFVKGYKCGVIGIGGLGHLALGYANKLGMNVTAFTTSFDREQQLKELGAHQISSSVDPIYLNKEKGQYDIILTTLVTNKPELTSLHLNLLKRGGKFIVVGLPPKNEPMVVNTMDLVFNQIQLIGSLIGNYDECCEMLEFSKEHSIYPIVQEFPFEEFNKAFELLEKGRPQYRVVVNIKDWAQKNGFDR